MLLSYYSFQLLAAVLIKSDLVLIKAGCWRCTPPSPFFVLFWRWVGGERFGGFEAYSSELPPVQNCELLPSHFDEFASEGRGEASCKRN